MKNEPTYTIDPHERVMALKRTVWMLVLGYMLPFAVVSVLYMTWVLGTVIATAVSPERSLGMGGKKSELLSPAELEGHIGLLHDAKEEGTTNANQRAL